MEVLHAKVHEKVHCEEPDTYEHAVVEARRRSQKIKQKMQKSLGVLYEKEKWSVKAFQSF